MLLASTATLAPPPLSPGPEADVATDPVMPVLVLVLPLPETCSTTTGARALLPDPESTHDDVTEVITADGVIV